MTLSPERLAELQQLAEQAQQAGPWWNAGFRDAEHRALIAACDPGTVAALLARIQELETALREAPIGPYTLNGAGWMQWRENRRAALEAK